MWVYNDPAGHESFVLGVYLDNLQIAHSAELDVDGWLTDVSSFYAKFLSKLVAEWDVVDEGPMEDLLAIQLRVHEQRRLVHPPPGSICYQIARQVRAQRPAGA